jgi:hypothetical protein
MAPVFPALIKASTSFCLRSVIPFTRDELGLVLTIVELLSFILTLSVRHLKVLSQAALWMF